MRYLFAGICIWLAFIAIDMAASGLGTYFGGGKLARNVFAYPVLFAIGFFWTARILYRHQAEQQRWYAAQGPTAEFPRFWYKGSR